MSISSIKTGAWCLDLSSDGILSRMGRVRRYFDRVGAKWEMEYAVAGIIGSVLFCIMGALVLARSHKTGEQFGFYWGVFLIAFGLLGILYRSLLTRAVARRLKAERAEDEALLDSAAQSTPK